LSQTPTVASFKDMRIIDGGKGSADESGQPREAEGDADKREADSAFDDMVIEVDLSELEAELDGQPPGGKS